MEELRSTEVLDKEIREDSLKKADKILKKAEDTARQLVEGVQSRVESARVEAEKRSADSLALFEKNVKAAVPLEKQRYLVSYIYGSVIEGINSYFEKTSEDNILGLLSKRISGIKDKFEGKTVDAEIVGLDLGKSETMLKKIFASSLGECCESKKIVSESEMVKGLRMHAGVILKSKDGLVSGRITLDEIVRDLLDTKSEELAKILFCGRLG